MLCWGAIPYNELEINGECPDCGADTIDEEAVEVCGYSPVICNTCGYAPCDGSC